MNEKKIKVYLGIPSTGVRQDLQLYFLRLTEKKYADRIELVYPEKCVHRSFHDFARNSIVEEFLASDCDILWFLDSDIVPPENVLDLVADHHEKWKVAGACYPIWMVPPGGSETCVLFTAYKGVIDDDTGEFKGIRMTEVPPAGQDFIDGLATGCMFIKREIFAQLQKPYFEFKYEKETRQFKEGEDLGFCLKMHRLGIKFFTDYSMVCKHYKTVCLLDVNNYATSWSNSKTLEYDKEVRAQVQYAVGAAEKAGYERARRELSQPTRGVSKSGLILPANF